MSEQQQLAFAIAESKRMAEQVASQNQVEENKQQLEGLNLPELKQEQNGTQPLQVEVPILIGEEVKEADEVKDNDAAEQSDSVERDSKAFKLKAPEIIQSRNVHHSSPNNSEED